MSIEELTWEILSEIIDFETLEWVSEDPNRGVLVAYADYEVSEYNYITKGWETRILRIYYNPLEMEMLYDTIDRLEGSGAIVGVKIEEGTILVTGEDLQAIMP